MRLFTILLLPLLFLSCSKDEPEDIGDTFPAPASIQALGDSVLADLQDIRELSATISPLEVHFDTASFNVWSDRNSYMGEYNPIMQQMGYFQDWTTISRSLVDEYFDKYRYFDGKMGGYFSLGAAPSRITLVARTTDSLYVDSILIDPLYHKTIAHEMTHMLQYQNTLLDDRLDIVTVDDWLRDNIMPEGDACFTMDLYHATKYANPVNHDSLLQYERDEVALYEKYFSEQLIGDYSTLFLVPYLYGTLFVAENYKQFGWDSINAMQVEGRQLHNQFIITGDVFDEEYIDLTSLEGLVSSYPIWSEDIFGSAVFSALMNTYSSASELEKISKFREQYSWRGDKIVMYDQGSQFAYIWAIAFDSNASARYAQSIIHTQNTTIDTPSRPQMTRNQSDSLNDSTSVYRYGTTGFASYQVVQGNKLWIIENPTKNIDVLLQAIIE